MHSRRSASRRVVAGRVAGIAFALMLPGAAWASNWKVVAAKSWLGFEGDTGGSKFQGRFAQWDAQINFDPAQAQQSHAIVTIDMASAATGDEEKDQALPQADWFNANVFPKATLTVRSFRPGGAHDYNAVGMLVLRDASKPIEMPMTIAVDGDTLHATGHLDLVRTDYGVGASVAAQWVGLGVTASFDVTAIRAP